jgi:hypothetical protein
MEDALLNLQEAATYLRVSRRVLRELYLRRKFSGRLIKLPNLGLSEVGFRRLPRSDFSQGQRGVLVSVYPAEGQSRLRLRSICVHQRLKKAAPKGGKSSWSSALSALNPWPPIGSQS